MDSNTQKKSPMFAEVNVERQAKEVLKREDRPKRRFTYIKLTYPTLKREIRIDNHFRHSADADISI